MFVGEGVGVFHVDAGAVERVEDGGQAAGTVGHFDPDHFRDLHGKAVALEQPPRLVGILHDEAQDAELAGVRQREGLDVDAGFGQQPARRAERAGFVRRAS